MGCTALICALSIENGLFQIIKNDFFTFTPHLWIYNANRTPLSRYDMIEEELRKIPSVIGTAPYCERKGVIHIADNNIGVTISGIAPEREKQFSYLHTHIAQGSFLSEETDSKKNLPGVIIGKSLATTYRLSVGSEITLMTLYTDNESTPSPIFRTYIICGLFKRDMSDIGMNTVYITLQSAQRQFGMDSGSVDCVQARIKNPFNYKPALTSLQEHQEYAVETWIDKAGLFFTSMKIEKNILFFIFSMIILIGVQGLSATVRLLYLSKRKQIGILNALGMSAKSIRLIFFLNGFLRGGIASVLGIAFGLLLCYIQITFGIVTVPFDVYIFREVPVKVELLDVVLTLAGSLFASTVIPLISSRKASVPSQYFRE